MADTEAEALVGCLDRQRATFAWKCGGLDGAGLRRTLGPSTITLGGLLKHMTRVEEDMFSTRLHGRPPSPPWDTVDWEWDWRTAADDPPDQLWARWQDAVAHARVELDQALADGGLDRSAKGFTGDGGEPYPVRLLLLHMIEEYARHVGHADLVRESVDGLVGDNPPG